MDFEDFERRLAAHWKGFGRHELVDQAPRISTIARAAHATFSANINKQDAEVSPFIYVMF